MWSTWINILVTKWNILSVKRKKWVGLKLIKEIESLDWDRIKE